jgi:uncharacterized membrane protein
MPLKRAQEDTSMTATTSVGAPHSLHFEVRRVPASAPVRWLSLGWDDLKQIGKPGLAHGVLIAILGGVLLMLGSTHFYMVAAAITGYLLVGPIMTTGACELARRRAAGDSTGFDESLQGLSRNPDGLTHFGEVLAVVAIAWFVLSAFLLQSVFGATLPSLAVALWGGAGTLTDSQILGYVVCGGVLAVFVFTTSVVAVPLIIDRRAGASEAMRTSLQATLANLPAMLVWALLIVGLTAIGFLTLLIGMIVIAPLLGYATWHAYRELIV